MLPSHLVFASSNVRNKIHLLEAELSSYESRDEDANASYAAAILASRSSGFIHEQGLACELAGFHYKKMGDLQCAQDFFNQAILCYTEWGSEMKVDSITQQLGVLVGNSCSGMKTINPLNSPSYYK